ncbi:MAG: UDP-N-acetylmuramoyl-L-alanine--D-glutamate ligase [Ardenticatenales bacterium]|nr:UDP-N-acetylmuramoyl-L-alanine--D-glutamate ligase [Ardenticatenales bacterium]
MDEWAGKRLVILGLARQGKALARFAAEVGAKVTISDMRPAEKLVDEMADLADLEIEYVLGGHPMSLVDKADILAISGGVPADAEIVTRANDLGVQVTNDSQEFIRRATAQTIGITGSAGKTTTTALTGVMAQIAERRVWVGGNIGKPLISDLHKMAPTDLVVQELSSFQLEIWRQSPEIATVLNLTPNHLDRHKTMAIYANAKANILRHQKPSDIAVLCLDDPGSKAMARHVQGRLRWFSRFENVSDGACVRNGQIWLTGGEREQWVCEVSDIQLRGEHNIWNVLAATVLADSAGIPVHAIRHAIQTFRGVEHRLEIVRTLNGVMWVNDSIATSPERALAAIDSFDRPIILLAGGRDKDMVWETWALRVKREVKQVIAFGDLAEKIEQMLCSNGNGLTSLNQLKRCKVERVATLAEAVALASKLATAPDVVLLSPGGTSFDAFNDFAQRGNVFKELVGQLQAD